jgi:hypothetical protein
MFYAIDSIEVNSWKGRARPQGRLVPRVDKIANFTMNACLISDSMSKGACCCLRVL